MTKELTLKEHLQSICRKGGASRSTKKIKSAKENIRKALHAKHPRDPRWMPKA